MLLPSFGIWTHEIFALVFTGLIVALSTSAPKGISLEHPGLRYLGNISYGMYVLHFAVLRIVFALLGDGDAGTAAFTPPTGHHLGLYVLTFALTILLAAVSYRFLERPFLKLKDRFAVVKSGR